MTLAAVGRRAPDFELAGTSGAFRLSAQRGQRVVLLFHPGKGKPAAAAHLCAYRDRADELACFETAIVAISPDPLDHLTAFATQHRLTMPLLADLGGRVARLYGAAGRRRAVRPALFLIDARGIVRYRHVHPLGLMHTSVSELVGVLEGAASAQELA